MPPGMNLVELKRSNKMAQYFMGTKIVYAWPEQKDGKAGYAIRYPDGYTSWSPAIVFEKAYLPVGQDSTRITQKMVDDFISHIEPHTFSPKTTVVKATLVNGYVITESSSCVDPSNYDAKLGEKICTKRIKDKVWELLGFMLQTAQNGIKVLEKKE